MAIVVPFPQNRHVEFARENAVEATCDLKQYQQFVESVLALMDQVSRT